MSRSHTRWSLPILTAFAVGCTDTVAPPSPVTPARDVATSGAGHLVVFEALRVPRGFEARVEALGGRLERSLDELGVAIVTGLADRAATELASDSGVRGVEPRAHATFELPDDDAGHDAPPLVALLATAHAASAATVDHESSVNAALFARQWNLRAVNADAAWAAGHVGSRKVTVAIVDTGIDYLHPELVGLVDLERSISFASDDAETRAQYPDREPFTDRFHHGTATAMSVASNARQLAGVNRHVTLLAVKIAGGPTLVPVDVGLAAIDWAVKQRVDVMAVGGGIRVDRNQSPVAYDALVRAFEHAWRKGVLTVAPAGQASRNRDLDLAAGVYGFPCDAPHAICVAFTAPRSAAGVDGPWDDVDALQPTSNFGSVIAVAAPGGGRAPNTNVWLGCTTSPSALSAASCRPGPAYTGLLAGVGTSWASATTAGLAAMLVTKYGHNHPDLIRARILATAHDLDAPGWDPRTGWGRIDVARAMDVPVRRGRNEPDAP